MPYSAAVLAIPAFDSFESLIATLPSMDEPALLHVRSTARSLGHCAWRLECAADAELLYRYDGKDAGHRNAQAVKQLASQTGETPNTIYRNARIHRKFFNGSVEAYPQLEDKSFFIAALEADDPDKAIKFFVEQKRLNARYTSSAALTHVRSAKSIEPEAQVPMFLETPEQQQAFQEWLAASRKLLDAVPRWKFQIKGWIEEAQYEATRPTDTWCERIKEKIRAEFNTTDLLAAELSLPRIRMTVILNRMLDDRMIRTEAAERTPGTRGPVKTIFVVND